jgi:8-oxo-dGTP pyrophosphatase MutT (NUDIX family)
MTLWFTTSRISDHQELTPEGFLLCRDVPIARCGTQLYRNSEIPQLEADDNGWISVDREPSEVFRPDSIASFSGKPIVNDHPMDIVTPDNWGELAIGVVGNVRRGQNHDHDLLIADLLFTTKRGINLVRGGKRALSVGYDAFYSQVAKGMGRQSQIVANHVALVDEGRCGARCTILDRAPHYGIDAVWQTGDVEFDPAKHPHAPAGAPGGAGGQFTSTEGGGGVSGKSTTYSKTSPAVGTLNGVEFAHWDGHKDNQGWEDEAKAGPAFDEPPLPKTTKKQGAGVIIRETDGRVWIVHPTKQFGGYNATFPKGGVEPGMSLKGTALKEAYEESGLRVKLTGYAGDVDRSTSTARYYYAERVGGAPHGHGWESEAVTLASPDKLKEHLNTPVDHKMVDDLILKEPKAKPQPSPTKPGEQSKPELDSADFTAQTGPQKGSNPGGKFKHKDGKEYYVKFSKSDDHARNEHLASKLYQAAGAPILDAKLVNRAGKLATATEWKEGIKLIDENDKDQRKEAQRHFATHAWLANWDAAGLEYDNQGKVDGKMTTLDPGGSLLYRAQGGPKGGAWNDEASEWESLRSSSNAQAHKIYGEMTPEQLRGSAWRVMKVPDQTIRDLTMAHGPGSEADRKALAERLIARKAAIAKKATATIAKKATGDATFATVANGLGLLRFFARRRPRVFVHRHAA